MERPLHAASHRRSRILIEKETLGVNNVCPDNWGKKGDSVIGNQSLTGVLITAPRISDNNHLWEFGLQESECCSKFNCQPICIV